MKGLEIWNFRLGGLQILLKYEFIKTMLNMISCHLFI